MLNYKVHTKKSLTYRSLKKATINKSFIANLQISKSPIGPTKKSGEAL